MRYPFMEYLDQYEHDIPEKYIRLARRIAYVIRSSPNNSVSPRVIACYMKHSYTFGKMLRPDMFFKRK